jgi:uncharacterized protein (TIGR03118 family)
MQKMRSGIDVYAAAATMVLAGSLIVGISGSPAEQAAPLGDQRRPFDSAYVMHRLVSDGSVKADHADSDLVNPWGLAFNPFAFAWVANNGTGVSTLYDGHGVKNPLVVQIPPAPTSAPPSTPTGIVYSGGTDFVLTVGALKGPSRFIFATEDGTISAWAPNVDMTHAILTANNAPSHAVYKGLALAANGSGHFLYATDFHHNKIDVFDSTFAPVTLSGSFKDPLLPQHYAPFGIQNVLGNLYVTYAKQDDTGKDDVAGVGLGFVDVFNADGHLIRRFASRGSLNAPWGIALAPADFGRFSNTLLVGNFGDGRINAYDLESGDFRGQLRGTDGHSLAIDGLWALAFGNGFLDQPVNSLFFTAGPDDEKHGVYGKIDAMATRLRTTN